MTIFSIDDKSGDRAGQEWVIFAEDNLVPFRCSQLPSCMTPFQTEAQLGGCLWQHDTRLPSARPLAMVRVNSRDRSEGSDCL
ncbi:hypothetical protein TNCV_4756291 [Trichonephila clavipes]|nr:hypothetical protein TNCV_4756291 [Trichonephila clavipes]